MDNNMMMNYFMNGYSTNDAIEAFTSGEMPEPSYRSRRKPKNKRGLAPKKTKVEDADTGEDRWESCDTDDGDDSNGTICLSSKDNDEDGDRHEEFNSKNKPAGHNSNSREEFLHDGLDHETEDAWRSGELKKVFADVFGDEIPGKAIDYDSAECKSKTMSEKAEIRLRAYTVDLVDVMAARALSPSWNKKMDLAVTAGRKTEFLRVENAKAALQIMTQREIQKRISQSGKGGGWMERHSPRRKAEDWKTHKLTCGNPSTNSSSNPPMSQPQALPNTTQGSSSYDSCHSMLQGPKEEKIFKHLIDAYRFRVEDEYAMTGDVSMDSLYGGGNPMTGFKRFLAKAEKKSGVLLSWWDKKARARCEKPDHLCNMLLRSLILLRSMEIRWLPCL